MKIMLKLQFLTSKKYSEPRSTVENCIFSKLQFFKCTSIAIPLHIFAVYMGTKPSESVEAKKAKVRGEVLR